MTTENLRMVTATNACDLLAISRSTLDRMIAKGDLPAFKIGRSVRIPIQAIHDYLEANTWLPTT